MNQLAQPTIDVYEFARAIRTSNPFISNRVTQADTEGVDVSAIHDKEFKQLVKRISGVSDRGDTSGVLLLGAAGVGKSHVLARLFRWAHDQSAATVVYLHNLLASPERLPRYLLGAVMSSLAGFRPYAYPQSELYALINRAIGTELERSKFKGTPNLAQRTATLKKIGKDLDPRGLVMPVFIAFLEQAMGAANGEPEAETRSKAALQWLSGETIEPALAGAIGLKSEDEEGACIVDDVGVQQTLDIVCRLCGKAGRPLVLCVDQVDNLDGEKVTALSSFLHAALDNGHSLVVVTSGVKQSMLAFEREGIIAQAAWDRLAQFKIELNRITADESRMIIAERIRRFMTPFNPIDGVRILRERDPLLPLGAQWFDDSLGKVIEIRPRDVINKAREHWEQEQERLEELGAEAWLAGLATPRQCNASPTLPPLIRPLEQVIDETTAKKVKEATSERVLNPERLPPDADNLATLTMDLLKICEGHKSYTLRKVDRIRSRGVSTYDIRAIEEAPGGGVVHDGLVFVTADNAVKSAWALKRLVEDDNPPTHQILVTDNERRPLKLGAKGQEHLEALSKRRGFQHLRLSFEDYAGLDALSVVLGSARVGDLEIEQPAGDTRSISEAECLESLHRQGYFLGNPLLRELLTEDVARTTPPPPSLKPTEDVIRQRIAAELHWRLGMTGREMTEVLIAREGLDAGMRERLWPRILEVAKGMHSDGHLFAAAQDDDLFLQFRKKDAV